MNVKGAASEERRSRENLDRPATTSRPAGTPGASRRQTYVSVNHLLNFEVSSGPSGFGGGGPISMSPPRRSHRAGGRPGASFTKERFIHANFRFVALDSVASNSKEKYLTDPDAPLEWAEIELVIVPAQHDVACPICLDTPLAPRLTKCGHFFCWPCILQYAAANAAAGTGNWRKCPICFESISVRQLKSVYFSQVEDYASNTALASEVGIPMMLLQGQAGVCQVVPAGGTASPMDMGDAPSQLSDLSPFTRIFFVSRSFVAENVVNSERQALAGRLAMMEDDDADKVFVELALTMVDDRQETLAAEAIFPSPLTGDAPKTPPSLPSTGGATLYFHQSSDGQPFFLCPLSIKMLKRQFGSYDALPASLCAPVVEIEMAVMTEELRKRHRYLHHLPIGCQFGLCEVDLSGIVPSSVMEEFAGELQARARHRKHKAHREERLAAEANRRALRRQTEYYRATQDEVAGWEGRTTSPAVPGVAMGIFMDDYENFPLPPGSEELPPTTAIPIAALEVAPRSFPSGAANKPLAGSFASVAATSPQSDGFLVVGSSMQNDSSSSGGGNAIASTNVFELSFDDLPNPSVPSSGTETLPKKGKRVLLVSNAQRRRS